MPKGNGNNFGTLSTKERQNGQYSKWRITQENQEYTRRPKSFTEWQSEYEGEQMGGNDALALSVFNKALKGDVQAFKEIRDTVGEKPKDMIELEDTRVQNIEINFVDKSRQREEAEEDPKIIGEYTNGIDTEDSG